MFVGGEPFQSVWGGASETLASTWRAVLSFDVGTLLRQWISGALGLVVIAGLAACAVQLLPKDTRN
jgi:hypothetical protein